MLHLIKHYDDPKSNMRKNTQEKAIHRTLTLMSLIVLATLFTAVQR